MGQEMVDSAARRVVADQLEIREALLAGALTWQQALDAVTASKAKPWHTKAWKKMRDARIGDRCDQCGALTPPMVLQHLRQPHSFGALCDEIRSDLLSIYEQENPRPTIPEPSPVDRPVCPQCRSTAISPRKTGPYRWKCLGKTRGRTCGHEFNDPAAAPALTPQQKQEWSAQKYEAYRAWRAEFDARYDGAIHVQAVVRSIEEHVRYMSLEDTATFCKKCAFMWDQRQSKLCHVCKEGYHEFWLSRCRRCDTTNYRLCAVCGQHYHEIIYPTCYACRGSRVECDFTQSNAAAGTIGLQR